MEARSDGAGRARSARARREVIVLAGGDPVTVPLPGSLPADPLVIAADGGLAVAEVLHLDVDLLVGDLDSVAADALAAVTAAGVAIERHPVDKDRTDLAIALDAARRHDPERITVVGGHGGRLDHLLGGLALLASPRYADMDVVAYLGDATVTVVHDRATLTGVPDELISLLPVHGAATGVTTRGLRFPLDDEGLDAGSSRGVSNRFASNSAMVSVRTGTLLAVQPGGDERS